MIEVQRELRREYREGVAALEDRIIWMGDRIGGMLDVAMGALATGDAGQAEGVRRSRDEVARTARRVREDVLRTLALQAPVAGELKLISAMIHVNIHLERMAGLAANLARAAGEVDLGAVDGEVAAQVSEMGVHARTVLERAVVAFTRRDEREARRLATLDDPLDQLNRSVFRRLLQLGGDEQAVERALRLVLVARYLERFGDHAVALGETTTEL